MSKKNKNSDKSEQNAEEKVAGAVNSTAADKQSINQIHNSKKESLSANTKR